MENGIEDIHVLSEDRGLILRAKEEFKDESGPSVSYKHCSLSIFIITPI